MEKFFRVKSSFSYSLLVIKFLLKKYFFSEIIYQREEKLNEIGENSLRLLEDEYETVIKTRVYGFSSYPLQNTITSSLLRPSVKYRYANNCFVVYSFSIDTLG